MRFEWDRAKARENLRKHGVSFLEAESAFSDDEAIVLPDPDHSLAEDRFILVGLGSNLRWLTVVHAFSADTEVIQILSARRATRSERAQYGARWKR